METMPVDPAEPRSSADSVWLQARFAVLAFLTVLGLLTPVMAIFNALPAVCCPTPAPTEEIVAYARKVRLYGLVAWGGMLLAAFAAAVAASRRGHHPLGNRLLIHYRPALWVARVGLAVGLYWIADAFPVGDDESWAYAFFLANVWDFAAVGRDAHFAVTAYFVSVGLTWRGHRPQIWLLPVFLTAAVGARNLGLVWALATGQPAAPY